MRLDRLAPTVIDWLGKADAPGHCSAPLAVDSTPRGAPVLLAGRSLR
jgi:hypothetical protein